MRFTVLGAAGFVGTAAVAELIERGHDVQAATRARPAVAPLGHVIDCVGVTADFRTRPLDAMEAHVGRVGELLRAGGFDSFLYLSSTRVYANCAVAGEDVLIPVDPSRPDELYNISKLAGETLCLSDPRPTVRVARVSNVVGPGADGNTFLARVLADALAGEEIVLGIDPRSERDFIGVDDVISLLLAISVGGQQRLYNVASGENRAAGDVLDDICRLTGTAWRSETSGPLVRFPPIIIDRVHDEFSYVPTRFDDVLASVLQSPGSVR